MRVKEPHLSLELVGRGPLVVTIEDCKVGASGGLHHFEIHTVGSKVSLGQDQPNLVGMPAMVFDDDLSG